jgi:uncharacterized protein (TIGR02099 family)
MTTPKIIFRRAKTLLWTAFSILVVLAAVGVGVGQLLMPYSDRYQPQLEAWLSKEFGRPIQLESFSGEWTAFGPRLRLQGMRLMPAAEGELLNAGEAVAIESAALDVTLLNAFIPDRPIYNFRVIGADFELRHTADGRFELSGFGVSGRNADPQNSALKELARIGEVILQDSNLIYQDEKHGILLGFNNIQGALQLQGDELSTEIQARFYDARSGLEYGDIEATLLLTLDDDQRMLNASWQATGKELMLAAFQGRLPQNPFLPITGWLNASMWGEWSRQTGHLIIGETDLREARLVNEYQDLRLDRINSRMRWQHQGRGKWELNFADLLFDDGVQSWTAPRLTIERDVSADRGLWISADELPLGVPLNLARDIMSIYDTSWPAFLPGAADGVVRDLDLVLNAKWGIELAEGSVTGASVLDWDRWPELTGLDAEVSLRSGSGLLRLSGAEIGVDWPRMFRDPLLLSIPTCQVDLMWGQGWQVGINDCGLENEDLALHGQAIVKGDDGKPDVDVNVAFTRGSLDRVGPYWPEAIMKDSIKKWLRKGIKAGELQEGRFQIHGDLDDWPFRSGKGRYEAFANISNGRVAYMDGWPEAAEMQARVGFVDATMSLSGSIGDIGGLQSDTVTAGIADMGTPVLKVAYKADTDLPAAVRFFQQSPLQEQVDVDLNRFIFAGAAQTEGLMTVPLGESPGQLQLAGVANIPEGFFSDPASEITLENMSGELRYDETGFSGSALDVMFRGYPAQLDLDAGTGREESFRADLVGIFGVRDVIPSFLLESYAALSRMEGDCLWSASISVPSGSDGAAVLVVESGLDGVGLNLPAPLHKPAGEHWPLEIRYPLSGPQQLLDIEFAERAMLRFDLSGDAESPHSSIIRLGPGKPDMPPDGLIRVEGRSPIVDLDGWIEVIIDGALAGGGMGGLDLEKGSLQAGKLLFLDRYFDEVSVDFDVVDSDIRAEFRAEDINGNVRFTTGEAGMSSLFAEFERLVLADPVSEGLDMDTDPADLPALHLFVESFQYSGVELGETRIEAYPTSKGFHFEKVDAASDQISVQASGDWSLGEQGPRSDFEIHMASVSLGDFLNSMDISSSMQGGQTLVDFSAWWPGPPAAFALSRLNGQIEFSVVDGNITDASAGGGRLLGLLSITALPKRLSLDFRDVFDAGFSFDKATGTFEMENGTATTDDMLLDSSAASISIAGSTDLVEQQYDQLLTVRPGLGNTLPIIGAIAGGPVGAAAGLALQGLLHEQIGEATQVQYTITGDWEDPVFEPFEIELAETPSTDNEQKQEN